MPPTFDFQVIKRSQCLIILYIDPSRSLADPSQWGFQEAE